MSGWTESNNQLRSKLIEHIDSEIICINETHLKNEQTITLEGYRFYAHNRQHIHINAPKGSGGRALSAVISKIQSHKDVGFKTYSKLFSSCVVSVLDYCSGVWGFKQFDKTDMIQDRAIRHFMGVHRFTRF